MPAAWLLRVSSAVRDDTMAPEEQMLLCRWYYACPQTLVAYMHCANGTMVVSSVLRQVYRAIQIERDAQPAGICMMSGWYSALVEYFTLYPMRPAELCRDTDPVWATVPLDLARALMGPNPAQNAWHHGECACVAFGPAQELGILFADVSDFAHNIPWHDWSATERILDIVLRRASAMTYRCLTTALQLAATEQRITSMRAMACASRIAGSRRRTRIVGADRDILAALASPTLCGN